MDKKYSIFITVLFCLFTFGFGAALILTPSRDFSEQENRFLAQFKAPTADTLRSGKFMESFEKYVSDQFPLRDQWIQLKAYSEKALGKQENNKVYFGTDGQTLFAQFTPPTNQELSQRVGCPGGLCEQAGGQPGRAGVLLPGAGQELGLGKSPPRQRPQGGRRIHHQQG